jgi:hypothetical protein
MCVCECVGGMGSHWILLRVPPPRYCEAEGVGVGVVDAVGAVGAVHSTGKRNSIWTPMSVSGEWGPTGYCSVYPHRGTVRLRVSVSGLLMRLVRLVLYTQLGNGTQFGRPERTKGRTDGRTDGLTSWNDSGGGTTSRPPCRSFGSRSSYMEGGGMAGRGRSARGALDTGAGW